MSVTLGPLDRLAHWLLPAPCLGCGRPLPVRRSPLALCRHCHRRLERRRSTGNRCEVCLCPLNAAAVPEGYRCGRCRRTPPAFDRLVAPWSYAPPLDAVIRALKFRRLDFLAPHLGSSLAEALQTAWAGTRTGPPDELVVVPVPLHWHRRFTRGYDQAQLIARAVAARLDLPLARLLRRNRATPPQSSLERPERRRNLDGAFRCRRPRRVAGRSVLLVDDVVTTGATLDAAARALRRAGAAYVLAAAAARTPFPGELDRSRT